MCWAHSPSQLWADCCAELVGKEIMRDSAECTKALQDLGRILLLIQINCEKAIVGGQVVRWRFACAQKVRDVFHLDKRHGRFLELDTRSWSETYIGKSMGSSQYQVACGATDIRRLRAFLTYRHKMVPSFSRSKRSPLGNCSPSVSSIHARISLAA
jgi:hypothetical protein